MKNNIKLTLFSILGILLGFALKSLIVSDDLEKINNDNTEHIKQLEFEHWKETSDTLNYLTNVYRKVSIFYTYQSMYSNSFYKSKLSNKRNYNLIKLADVLVDVIVELREINLKEIGFNDLYVVRDDDSGSIVYLRFGSVRIIFSEELESAINKHDQLKKHIESL